jgi:hypothetical protein
MSNEYIEENVIASDGIKPLLDEEGQEKLIDFLCEEIRLAETERRAEEIRWATIRRQREGEPEFEHKDSPWPDASNIVPPGMMIAQNTVYGMTKNAFGARTPFWSIDPLNEKNQTDIRIARVLEKYMQKLADSPNDLNKRDKDREIQEECDLLGTAFVKVHWQTHKTRVPMPAPDGTSSVTEIIDHDGPEWIVVPREDAFYRIRERSVASARWWAHRIELEEADVFERFARGIWTEFEGWQGSVRQDPIEVDRQTDQRSGGVPGKRNVWDFYECHVRWDVEGNGSYDELVVVLHR